VSRLYPYGPHEGDHALPQHHADVASSAIHLPHEMKIGLRRETTAYVDIMNLKMYDFFVQFSLCLQVISNGYISFGYPFISSSPELFPLNAYTGVVAPFWSDVDTSAGVGNIYYHIYTNADSPPMVRACRELSRFTGHFSTKWLLVATWDKVPRRQSSVLKVNKLH
jgi:hypothetical protein